MVSKLGCGCNRYNDVGHPDQLTDIIVVQVRFVEFYGNLPPLRNNDGHCQQLDIRLGFQ